MMIDGRKMDVERGRVVHRERRARKLAVVVAVQNMLVAACLLVTLYVYWDVQKQKQKQEKVSTILLKHHFKVACKQHLYKLSL